jgi:hypothetical protein
MFGVAARANGFSLTATVAGAGAYQNLAQGYNGTSNAIRGNLDAVASIGIHGALMAMDGDSATRIIVKLGLGFGDNRGDSEAILSGYDTR